MIHIIGEEVVKEAQTFNDVRNALDFDYDIYLAAMWANPLGIRLEGKVIYNMEYLYDESPLWKIGYLETLKNNIVLDFSKKNIEYLKKIGIEAFYLPYGYHPSLERTIPTEKDIDVLFVGSTYHERRVQLLHDLDGKVNLFVAQGFYRKELDELIPRAKVHLNMHHVDGQTLETVRLNYLMANHCNIVSERGNDSELNSRYEGGLRFAEYNNLIDVCLEAIKDPIDGHQTIQTMPMDCTAANGWVGGKLCLQ